MRFKHFEENRENIEPFEQLDHKYAALHKKYVDAYCKLQASILKEGFRREYAKGGQTVHRGFYSPSSLDVFVGGCNRGSLLKRPPKKENYNYEYIFNIKGNIICSKCYDKNASGERVINSVEMFLYEDNCILGLEFAPDADYRLIGLSTSQYEDTRLVKYEYALLKDYGTSNMCAEINVEIFDYEDNLLKAVNWYRYTPSIKLLTHNEIYLFRDADGHLSAYTIKENAAFAHQSERGSPTQRYAAKKGKAPFHDTHRFGSA